jgi:hypothetical protein
MGKINQGILGGFSGKVGTVIGSNWNGIQIMRAKSNSSTKSQTLLQIQQRAKFALAISTLQPLTPLLRVGFKQYSYRQSSFNAAVSHTIKNAIMGEYPNYALDYSQLLVSRGTLTGANVATAQALAGKIKINWQNNGGNEGQLTDRVLVAILNPNKGQVAFVIEGALRSALSEEVAISPFWIGDKVEVYLAFVSGTGAEVATSRYLGSVVVV